MLLLLILASLTACESSYLLWSSEEINSSEFGASPGLIETSCPCGWSNKENSRIIGGKKAKPNEFPFAVALIDKFTNFSFCGATLISNRHVITGAHCTRERKREGDPISVILGGHDITTGSKNQKIIDVKEIIEHENFNRMTLLNDVAVLILEEKIKFDANIGPVCLPIQKKNLDEKTVRIIGWGHIKTDGTKSPVLKKVNVRVVDIKTCSYNYPGRVSATHQTQICTFGRRKGSCQGDSGGPVVWLDPETNMYTLVGIVSFGKSCASSVPSVNTDVFAYIDWIKRAINVSEKTAVCTKRE